MRAYSLLIPAVLALACGEGELDDRLSGDVPCSEEKPCNEGFTCLASDCVEDNSLEIGGTCTLQLQCQTGLICHEFICKPGCTDIYYLDHCQDDTWCKPLPDVVQETPDGPIPVGECSPSECFPPGTGLACDAGYSCVAVTSTTGACLPYCSYGFVSGGYVDICIDHLGIDHACQTLGLNGAPVCLPAGIEEEEAPTVGEPGCDTIRNPCRAGSICIDVVCRQLCSYGQPEPCAGGELCRQVGTRTDVAYCRAE